jgi:hypothetical protein
LVRISLWSRISTPKQQNQNQQRKTMKFLIDEHKGNEYSLFFFFPFSDCCGVCCELVCHILSIQTSIQSPFFAPPAEIVYWFFFVLYLFDNVVLVRSGVLPASESLHFMKNLLKNMTKLCLREWILKLIM